LGCCKDMYNPALKRDCAKAAQPLSSTLGIPERTTNMSVPDIAPQISAALIAAIVAATTAIASIALQIAFRILDAKGKKKLAIIEKRQEALLLALQVIDHVYANTAFNDASKSNPHEWDITLAREAMNKMILYCANPKRTIDAFSKAIGLHNPETQTAAQYGPRYLAEFRSVVCDELDLPITNHTDPDIVWIAQLPGSKKEVV
jgi:hypothetical protein